jgi:HEAT repeat protein
MVRATLATHVGTFRAKAKEAIPVLQTMVDTECVYARLTAAASIGKIDSSRIATLLPHFVDALDSTAICVPEYSAWLLRDFGAAAQGALPGLRQMLRDRDSTKRCAASDAIWTITGDSHDAIEVGLRLLDGPECLERVVGAEHLGCLGTAGQPAIPRLLQALGDEDPTVRATVRKALDQIRAGCLLRRL